MNIVEVIKGKAIIEISAKEAITFSNCLDSLIQQYDDIDTVMLDTSEEKLASLRDEFRKIIDLFLKNGGKNI